MSNDIFSRLHKRMTLTYTLIFGIIATLVVAAVVVLNVWSLFVIEKNEIYHRIVHEGEEWVSSKEAPVNEKELSSEDMLAHFVATDGKTVILNQLGNGPAGKCISVNRQEWPTLEEKTKLMIMQDAQGNKYHYLVGVAEIKDGNRNVGILYMFENFHVYYAAMKHTLTGLAIIMTVLFLFGGVGSYCIAGKSIASIRSIYNKQKQFTADASHEMRTPLAVMKLAVQGIRADEDSQLGSFTKEALVMLEREINSLTRLTEDLMELTRSDNDKLKLSFDKVELSRLCQTTAAQMELIAWDKNIVLEQFIAEKIEVQGNEASLKRLLIILLDNAIKYTPENSRIILSLTKNANRSLLQIKDEGVGIAEAEKDKVFERFYRVDKARSRSEGGLGLGLSLAKAIVKQHHGKIWLADNKPCGTIVNVEL